MERQEQQGMIELIEKKMKKFLQRLAKLKSTGTVPGY